MIEESKFPETEHDRLTARIISEVERVLGLAWLNFDISSIAHWSYAPVLNRLFHKRVRLLIERGSSEENARREASTEFNMLEFGIPKRLCEYCELSFNPTENLHLADEMWRYLDRKYCSKRCQEVQGWHNSLRKGMSQSAEFDKSITWEAVWDRFGPFCYICGIETVHDQPELNLRQGTKAWKARWGTYKRGDVDRQAVVEHIHPRSRGGSHTWDNVRIACSRCNLLKGDRVHPPST